MLVLLFFSLVLLHYKNSGCCKDLIEPANVVVQILCNGSEDLTCP